MKKKVKFDIIVTIEVDVDTSEFQNDDGSECTMTECVEDIVYQIDLAGEALRNLRRMDYRENVKASHNFAFYDKIAAYMSRTPPHHGKDTQY